MGSARTVDGGDHLCPFALILSKGPCRSSGEFLDALEGCTEGFDRLSLNGGGWPALASTGLS
jgi:hypothetical protein